MLARLFAYFENWIDPVSLAKNPHPPRGLKEFYLYFLGSDLAHCRAGLPARRPQRLF